MRNLTGFSAPNSHESPKNPKSHTQWGKTHCPCPLQWRGHDLPMYTSSIAHFTSLLTDCHRKRTNLTGRVFLQVHVHVCILRILKYYEILLGSRMVFKFNSYSSPAIERKIHTRHFECVTRIAGALKRWAVLGHVLPRHTKVGWRQQVKSEGRRV